VKAALVISERDNVATALEPLEPGRVLDLAGRHIEVLERIPAGHKIALVAIGAGAAVIKYGSAIGNASASIDPGTHVHTHNVVSSRGRGDLSPQAEGPAAPRLAEPDDDGASIPATGDDR
jgi:altronate dehydratase